MLMSESYSENTRADSVSKTTCSPTVMQLCAAERSFRSNSSLDASAELEQPDLHLIWQPPAIDLVCNYRLRRPIFSPSAQARMRISVVALFTGQRTAVLGRRDGRVARRGRLRMDRWSDTMREQHARRNEERRLTLRWLRVTAVKYLN